MKRYLLDTGPLAAYLFGRPQAIEVIRPWIVQRCAATSILVYGEVVEYLIGRANSAPRQAQLRRLLREVVPFVLTYPILERYAVLRRQLRPPHGPGLIGDIDTLIAATALERNLSVVTTDSDFGRIPGLSVKLLPRLR